MKTAIVAVLCLMALSTVSAASLSGLRSRAFLQDADEPKCGKQHPDPQGNPTACPDGMCCSGLGYCGVTDAHCLEANGCQAGCGKKAAEVSGPAPEPVVKAGQQTQVYVKTISAAAPMCKECTSSDPNAAAENSEESGAEESLNSIANPTDPNAVGAAGAEDGAVVNKVDPAAAVGELADKIKSLDAGYNAAAAKGNDIVAQARAQASQIIANAKAASLQP